MKPYSKNQKGVSLIAAVFIIVILAFMGVMFVSLINTASFTSVNDLQSAQALYVAEGGLENTTLLLDTSNLTNRIACGSVTGNANLTNEPLGPGQFTVTGGSVYSSTPTTLNGAITSAATTITVFSTANYTASGRIMIDRELMDYAGITPGTTTTFAVLRGRDGTTAAAHANNAPVGQYQCTVTSQGGIPTVTSPAAMRTVTEGVQLQEGWAVGVGPTMLHWDGTAWSDVSGALPASANLNSISMLSYADGWSVGARSANNTAGWVFLRWNGATWTLSNRTTPNSTALGLNSVSMVSSADGWAVGGPNGNAFLHWSAGVWTNSGPAAGQLQSVHMLDTNGDGIADDGWAVGNVAGYELVYRFTGGVWTRQPVSGVIPNRNLMSVFCTSGTECFVAGAAGTSCRWTSAGGWTNVSPGGTQLNSVYMLDTNGDGVAEDGWAVGFRTANAINGWRFLRWNGAAWNTVTVTTAGTRAQNLNKVSCVNANDCWAVGNAGMGLHWDGNSWTLWNPLVSGVNQNLMNLDIIGPQQRPQAAWQEVFP